MYINCIVLWLLEGAVCKVFDHLAVSKDGTPKTRNLHCSQIHTGISHTHADQSLSAHWPRTSEKTGKQCFYCEQALHYSMNHLTCSQKSSSFRTVHDGVLSVPYTISFCIMVILPYLTSHSPFLSSMLCKQRETSYIPNTAHQLKIPVCTTIKDDNSNPRSGW